MQTGYKKRNFNRLYNFIVNKLNPYIKAASKYNEEYEKGKKKATFFGEIEVDLINWAPYSVTYDPKINFNS